MMIIPEMVVVRVAVHVVVFPVAVRVVVQVVTQHPLPLTRSTLGGT